MKKRVLIFVLLALLSFSLVACSMEDPVFTRNMPEAEILRVLDSMDNFTLEYSYVSESKEEDFVDTLKFDKTIVYTDHIDNNAQDDAHSSKWEFVEEGILYNYVEDASGEDVNSDYEKIDFNGYDTYPLSRVFSDTRDEYIQKIKDCINDKNYDIKYGDLVCTIENKDLGEKMEFVVSDVNKTQVTIPAEFSDRQERALTGEPVEFALSNDKSFYTISNIHKLVRAYTIPLTHNGKQVKIEYSNNFDNLEQLKISASIAVLGTSDDFVEVERKTQLHIFFGGTIEQWIKVEKTQEWTYINLQIRITCSDGDYVEDPNAVFKPNMSKTEVLAVLKNLKYFTFVDSKQYEEETLPTVNTYRVCVDGSESTNSSDDGISAHYYFVKENRTYEYSASQNNTSYTIIDYTSYNFDFEKRYIDIFRADLLSIITETIEKYGFAITNGCLTAIDEEEGFTYVIKNCGDTMPVVVPDEFADYESRNANDDAVKYQLSEDGTYYELSSISDLLIDYEVLQTYDDLPVKGVSTSYIGFLDEVTLPLCIESLPQEKITVFDNQTLHIYYAGTKAQWKEHFEDVEWTTKSDVTITCSDGKYDPNEDKYVFTADMTKDEAVNALNALTHFTVVVTTTESSEESINMYRFCGDVAYATETVNEWQYMLFSEGNRAYILEREGSTWSLDIVDYTGYDARINKRAHDMIKDVRALVLDSINNYGFSIESGCLTTIDSDEGDTYVVKNGGDTTPIDIPADIIDYASRTTNKDIVTYELSDDKTYYSLTYIDECLVKYTVPDKIDNIPVKKVLSGNFFEFDSIVLPEELDEITSNSFSDDGTALAVTFNGTKVQWRALSDNKEWTKNSLVTVTCSDGLFNPETDGYVTIKFYHTMGDRLTTVLDKYIEEFNKIYPYIHIEHDQIGGYEDVYETVSGGNVPNIVYGIKDHVAYYQQNNLILPLDEFISNTGTTTISGQSSGQIGLSQAQIDDFIDVFYNEDVLQDGKRYSLPLIRSSEVLYYNKTFFEERNYSVPTTWDEMETLCATIKQDNIDLTGEDKSTPLAVDSESNLFMDLCMQYGTGFTSYESGAIFDNDTNKAFVQRLKTWYENGYLTTQDIMNAYSSDAFVKQGCYMSIGSSASAGYFMQGHDDEVGVAMIPQVDTASPKVTAVGPSLCIMNKDGSAEQLASWLFVKYLTTDTAFQTEFSAKASYISVLESVAKNQIGEIGELELCYNQRNAYYTPLKYVGSYTVQDEVKKLIVSALTGEKTVDKAFEDAMTACSNN